MLSEKCIIEIRDEQMVDPTCFNANPNPTRRPAHFLKPSLNANSEPPSPPKLQSFSLTSRPKLAFFCGSHPLNGWQTWVHGLEATHGPLWRKAGIFDAIKASTYTISRDTHLILRLAERWCLETNTFVFPWGEASITLEDVFVLGGFSPLGESVLIAAPLKDNAKQVENKLIESYRELMRVDSYVSHLRWKEHFMGCGGEIEHAAFLSLWLARHVIPPRTNSVVWRGVFGIAARVCCGGKLAYGPVVLASIYRDLTVLKTKIVSGYCFESRMLKLLSPLHLVLVWAWERFPPLGPVPKRIKCGETRLARWDGGTRNLHDDIGMLLDSARDAFRWRPYAIPLENWTFPRFYVDSETWVMVDSDEEWEMIARCLMVSQLVGLDCIEAYNPHRVALQFGFDQDIPASCDACEPDLLEYEKNLNCLKLYIPHRLHEGDVTYRYSNWLKRTNLVEETRVGRKRRTNSIESNLVDETRVGRKRRTNSIKSNLVEETRVSRKRRTNTMTKAKKTSKICDTGYELVAVNIGGSLTENPIEKLELLQDFSSQQLLQSGSIDEMSCMLNLQCEVSSEEHTSMEEGEENEARRNNISVSEAVNGGISNALIEYNINIVHNKSGEIGLSLDSNEGADCMKNQEQMLMIEENREYLEEVDKCRSETATERNTSLIAVASEVNTLSLVIEKDEPKKALCEDPDINKADIPVDDQVAVRNPFAVICFQFESRISELEREISALSAC